MVFSLYCHSRTMPGVCPVVFCCVLLCCVMFCYAGVLRRVFEDAICVCPGYNVVSLRSGAVAVPLQLYLTQVHTAHTAHTTHTTHTAYTGHTHSSHTAHTRHTRVNHVAVLWLCSVVEQWNNTCCDCAQLLSSGTTHAVIVPSC